MAATSFNAFWAGPDKFSFHALHQHHCIDSAHPSPEPGTLLHQHLVEGGNAQPLHEEYELASDLDACSSPEMDSPLASLADSSDSDQSDVIWGDGPESSTFELTDDSECYSSAVESPLDSDDQHSTSAPCPVFYGTSSAIPSVAGAGDQLFPLPYKRYHLPLTIPQFIPQPVPSFSTATTIPSTPYHQAEHQYAQYPTFPSQVNHSSGDAFGVPTLVHSSGGLLGTTCTPAITPRNLQSSTPRKRASKKSSKPRAGGGEEDDDYRAEDDERLDSLLHNTACKVQNCLVCLRDLPESLRVPQPSWAAILRIVFYTLKVNYPHKEFFNLRSHVYDFVEAHWSRICIAKVKSEHWKKQLQDTLAHNKKLFASGAEVYKQKGFWRLDDLTDPWDGSVNPCLSHSPHTSLLHPSTTALDTDSSTSTGGQGGGGVSTDTPSPGADDGDDEYSPSASFRRHKKIRSFKRPRIELQA